MANTFDKYFNVSKEEITMANKERTFKKVQRAFDSSIDQIEEQLEKIDESIEKERIAIANGDTTRVRRLTEVLLDKTDATMLLTAVKKEAKDFTKKS